jgi:hypothetical protein
MRINLFKHIAEKLTRMLAYGIPADLFDDHLSMGESQAIKCVMHFAGGIVKTFSEEYLRAPDVHDTSSLWSSTNLEGF